MGTEFQRARGGITRLLPWLFAGMALLPRLLDAQEAPKLIRALGWDSDTQGRYVTSVAVDLQNNIWAGTEWDGLWGYDSRKRAWAHYTADEGLGGDPAHVGLGDDNVYAVAVDKLGRVWVGHLNHGVSVFNGREWKNYDLLDGPLGSRVFAIATCPTDGDVWIATDCGVARYSLARDDWDYFTVASGLPSNQAQAIAFDSKGNIFLGTQCDGVAMASSADNYRKWTVVAGPPLMPLTGTGDGLPSSLINSIAVTDGDKLVLVGTPEGLATSADDGRKWKFIRGQNWQAAVAGLYPVSADTKIDPPADPPMGQDDLLIEDWVTCVRQDPASKSIWIGYQKKGVEVRSEGLDKHLSGAGADAWRFYVRDIALPPKSLPLLATADSTAGGLKTLDKASGELEPGADPPKDVPPLPSPVKAPGADALAALTQRLDVFKNELKAGEGVFLGDDWRTQGDWVGRYGNSYALLCSVKEAAFEGEPGYEVNFELGPHNKGGTPENFVSQLKAPTARVLYNPLTGLRTEAEVNDLSSRKKPYPYYWQGPDLWVDVKVPAGLHRVSLYFLNNDEQTTWRDFSDKLRDYDLQLLPHGDDPDAVQKSGPMARTRVADFAGGVYKRFVVAGPGRFIFRAGRNHSFGTKLQGVFIDRLGSDAPDSPKSAAGFDSVDYSPAKLPDIPAGGDAALSAAVKLWQALDNSYGKAGADGLQIPLRIIAWRAAVAAHAPPALLANWRWKLAVWTQEDRDSFQKAAAGAFKDYSAKHPPPPPQQENAPADDDSIGE